MDTATALLDEDPRTAVVLADISAEAFAGAARRHPDRVLNVGIREQLMIGVAGGLALTGMRPIVHSYAPFVIDRAYEQIKLDLGHQDVGAVLVSVGGSYDGAAMGYTHFSAGDVALLDTLDGWTVHVPGHRVEAAELLRAAAAHDERVYLRLSAQENRRPHPPRGLHVVRDGGPTLVVAVGPMLEPTLAATAELDVTVAYTATPRPFPADGVRGRKQVVLVEPYLSGTSARFVGSTAQRVLHLGVGRAELRRYGTPRDHAGWHGLDAAGIHRAVRAFLDGAAAGPVVSGRCGAEPDRGGEPAEQAVFRVPVDPGPSPEAVLQQRLEVPQPVVVRGAQPEAFPDAVHRGGGELDGAPAQVGVPGHVAEVPLVGVEVQVQPAQQPGLVGDHEPAPGQQHEELPAERAIDADRPAHQGGLVVGLHATAEDRHVPADGGDGDARLGGGGEERPGEHVHARLTARKHLMTRRHRDECPITDTRRWLRSPFRRPRTSSAGRSGCRWPACGAASWS